MDRAEAAVLKHMIAEHLRAAKTLQAVLPRQRRRRRRKAARAISKPVVKRASAKAAAKLATPVGAFKRAAAAE